MENGDEAMAKSEKILITVKHFKTPSSDADVGETQIEVCETGNIIMKLPNGAMVLFSLSEFTQAVKEGKARFKNGAR
jgi:hypothetical protein